MLSALEKAKKNGAAIVAINPLPEAGLLRFENPQTVRGSVGGGTALADDFLQIRLGGDQALFQGLGKVLLEEQERAGGALEGRVFDTAFIEGSTAGLAGYLDQLRSVQWEEIVRASGLSEEQIRDTGARLLEVQGHGGLLGDGPDPAQALRGHASRTSSTCCCCRATSASPAPASARSAATPTSRATGPWASSSGCRSPSIDALDEEFGFASPREHGFDTVAAIRGDAGRPGAGLHRDGRQLRRAPPRTPPSPRRRWPTPG